MSEWGLSTHVIFIGCRSPRRLTSRMSDWRMKQIEAKWTKVNQSEPRWTKKVPHRFTEAEEQAVKKSYITPLHPSTLLLSFKTTHPNLPPQNIPFSSIIYGLNQYDLLIILYKYTYIPPTTKPSISSVNHTQDRTGPICSSQGQQFPPASPFELRDRIRRARSAIAQPDPSVFETALATRVGNQTTKGEAFAMLNILVHRPKVFALMYCFLGA